MNQFTYNRPDVSQLISKLRIKIAPKYRNLKTSEGPEGRLNNLRKIVNALFKYERLELGYAYADESRGYAERLISEAIRHGDSHRPTMELADYWLQEKQLIHKVFKVLVPRFENYQSSYTNLYKAPLQYPAHWKGRSVIELKGNPFPPMIFDGSRNKNLIHNVLMEEARREYRKSKYAEIAKKVADAEKEQAKMSGNSTFHENMLKSAQEVAEGEEFLKSSAKEDDFKGLYFSSSNSSDSNNSPLPLV